MKLKERSKMKRLIAIVLGIALISPTHAQADVSAFVHFYPKLESYTVSAPITDSSNNNYTFPVTIWNHQKLIDQVHFTLYDCNNLGQDTEWVVFNYKDNWGIPARGKDFYIGNITLNYSAWSRSGVGICTGNWNLKVIVVLINDVIIISDSELKVANSWIHNHINDIQKITDAWNAATKALEENQRVQAELKAKAEAEAKAAKDIAWQKEWQEQQKRLKAQVELNELIRQEFLKEEERKLRKFIGKPCKTLKKFKENEAGYLQCINKKGKKVWGYLSLYN